MSEIIEKAEKFFKDAFNDMKENAKAQHEVDKLNLKAVKAQSKVQFEEAKLTSKELQKKMTEEREEKIRTVKEIIAESEKRLKDAKNQQ